MKTVIRVLSILAASLFPLILSCSDDNGVNAVNTVYDLRTLSRLDESFVSTTENRTVPMPHKKLSGHVFVQSTQDTAPGVRGVVPNETPISQETYTYEYGADTHLYWTKATREDADGNIFATATQTLDDAGFPTRAIWLSNGGGLMDAYDYTYDKTLYLETSRVRYYDDPTDNLDATIRSEYSNVWNTDGILETRTKIEYGPNGEKFWEVKNRSTFLKNSLRGVAVTDCMGYWEYFKDYDEEGLLKSQEKTTFDSDGYPQTWSIDNNGDGTYEETYYSEITKTGEGYLESVSWMSDSTGDKYEKHMFAYDDEGLLKTEKGYGVEDDEFVLKQIITYVWYKNPVKGPTGGMMVFTVTDEEGKILDDYETVDWTVTQKTHHYYSSTGEELRRTTDSLEKISLQ